MLAANSGSGADGNMHSGICKTDRRIGTKLEIGRRDTILDGRLASGVVLGALLSYHNMFHP